MKFLASVTPAPGPVDTTPGGFPLPCIGFFDLPTSAEGDYAGGARNVSMARIADILSLGTFRTYKPVVDQTGLAGNYDFAIEFASNKKSQPDWAVLRRCFARSTRAETRSLNCSDRDYRGRPHRTADPKLTTATRFNRNCVSIRTQ